MNQDIIQSVAATLKPEDPSDFNLNQRCFEYSLEGLMAKLKLHYFDYLMQRASSLENILIPARLRAGEEGRTEDEIALP